MRLKITNPCTERKVFACLFWWAGWSVLLAGHHCNPPPIVHIRRILAWNPQTAERIEVEFLRGDQQTPTLLFTRYQAPETFLERHQETLRPPATLSPQHPLFALFATHTLSDPKAIEAALWTIAQQIARRRWPSQQGASRWRWLSPPSLSVPLRDMRLALDPTALLTTHPLMRAHWPPSTRLFVSFRTPQGEAPHLALALFNEYHRSLTPALAAPEQAHIRRLSCHQRWCWIEIDYGLHQGGHWITQRYLWALDTHLAQLFHARGYRAHDQKRYQEAAQDFSRAALLDPQFSDARYNLACTYSLLGRLEQAIALLKPLLQQPAYRKLACKDNDFAPLQKIPRYAALLSCFAPRSSPSSAPTSRPRSDREHKHFSPSIRPPTHPQR